MRCQKTQTNKPGLKILMILLLRKQRIDVANRSSTRDKQMGGGAVTIDEKISHNVSDSLTICVPVEIVVAVSLNFYHLRRNTVQNEENFSSIVACVVRPFTP